MKKIAIIYTVRPVLESFAPALEKKLDEKVIFHHLLDDFLASDPGDTGIFTTSNLNRLFNDVKNCEATKADLIVVTCSTLSPYIPLIQPFITVPVIAIDDAMVKKAVRIGSDITVLATASSTVGPTVSKIMKEAETRGKIVQISSSFDETAYDAMKNGDLKTHDSLVLQRVKEVKDSDVIVLAQASMSHLVEEAEKISCIPVVGSIDLCHDSIVEMIKELP